MTIIGIDMSKNSPGACIRTDEKIQFVSFIRSHNSGKIASHFEKLSLAGVKMKFYDYFQPSKMEYSESEVYKTNDAARYAKWIVSGLPETADFVGIEGFSYGSSGNSFIDIVGYGYAVRMALVEKYGAEKFSVFSPGNVKKTAGKGNANKAKMFEFFMDTRDESLKNNDFWKELKNKNISSVDKPVDDLCDSYFVQECAKNHFFTKNVV